MASELERDWMGWPYRTFEGVRVCARAQCFKGRLPYGEGLVRTGLEPYAPADEFRVNGYCSCECEELDELETALAAADKLDEDVGNLLGWFESDGTPILGRSDAVADGVRVVRETLAAYRLARGAP